MEPGRGLRLDQPNALAAVSKHGMSERDVYGKPLIGSCIVSFTRRNSIGSMFRATANSSMADSSAKM